MIDFMLCRFTIVFCAFLLTASVEDRVFAQNPVGCGQRDGEFHDPVSKDAGPLLPCSTTCKKYYIYTNSGWTDGCRSGGSEYDKCVTDGDPEDVQILRQERECNNGTDCVIDSSKAPVTVDTKLDHSNTLESNVCTPNP